MHINQIILVSRYEAKILRRNWLFIFLVFLAVCGSLALQWVIQGDTTIHFLKALSCSVPFVNAFLFNFVQGIFIVFIAGDFIQRNRHLDSCESLYVRPYKNTDYVIGKLLAIIGLFLLLNVLVCVIALIFHISLGNAPFTFFPYLFYLFTLTMPTILFLVGVTLWITSVLRTSFIIFTLLVGYVFLNAFVLSGCLYGSLDYLAISIPNVFSDVTEQHVGLFPYIAQRLAFALLGVAFMFFAMLRTKRLPNESKSIYRVRFAGYVMVFAGIWMGGCYYLYFEKNRQKRQEYVKLHAEYAGRSRMEILRQHIVYRQHKKQMIVNDTLTIRNPHSGEVNEFFLFLNPALRVCRIETEGMIVNFDRKDFVLSVLYPLMPGEKRDFVVHYSGKIDESVCYLDIPDKEYYNTRWSANILRYGKHTALLEDYYTLLTPECLWYPTQEFPSSPVAQQFVEKYFTDYVLTVMRDSSYTVISQGEAVRKGNTTCFKNNHALPGITLCIGEYNKREIIVDSVCFELYYFKEDGTLFTSVEATWEGLEKGIREAKEYFESLAGKEYPFRKLALVETPVGFCAYRGKNRKRSERVQPELVFKPENNCDQSYHYRLKEIADERVGAASEVSRTDIEGEMIRNFCTANMGEEISILEGMDLWDFVAGKQIVSILIENPASLIPMFSDFSGYVHSSVFPAVDRIVNEIQTDTRVDMQWNLYRVGETNEHKAIRCLASRSLREALEAPEAIPYLDAIFRLKGAYLRRQITSEIPGDRLAAFMRDFWQRNSFSRVSLECLAEEFKRELGFEFMAAIRELYEERGVASLYIQDAGQYMSEEGTDVIASFSVWNPSVADGIISVYTDKGDGTRDLVEAGNFVVYAGECSRINFLLPRRAMGMILQTNLAGNIPGDYVCNFVEEPRRKSIKAGREPLDTTCFKQPVGEIIVDNEDAGFQITESESRETFLNRLLHRNKQKAGGSVDFLTDNVPGWISSVYIDAYGFPIQSFTGKKTKNGKGRAEWTANIAEEGEYEVFVYQIDLDFRLQYQANEVLYYYTLEQQDYKADILMSSTRYGEKKFTLEDNQGRKEDFSLHVAMLRSDWVAIGVYFLQKGEVKIALQDRGAFLGQLIFADAVKWVKK